MEYGVIELYDGKKITFDIDEWKNSKILPKLGMDVFRKYDANGNLVIISEVKEV